MTKEQQIDQVWKALTLSQHKKFQRDAGILREIAERMVADHNHPAWKIILKI